MHYGVGIISQKWAPNLVQKPEWNLHRVSGRLMEDDLLEVDRIRDMAVRQQFQRQFAPFSQGSSAIDMDTQNLQICSSNCVYCPRTSTSVPNRWEWRLNRRIDTSLQATGIFTETQASVREVSSSERYYPEYSMISIGRIDDGECKCSRLLHLRQLCRAFPDCQAFAVAAMSCSAVRLPSSSPFSKSPSTFPI